MQVSTMGHFGGIGVKLLMTKGDTDSQGNGRFSGCRSWPFPGRLYCQG